MKGSQHETWDSILRVAESAACDRGSPYEALGPMGWLKYWQWEWKRFGNLEILKKWRHQSLMINGWGDPEREMPGFCVCHLLRHGSGWGVRKRKGG